ncbi:MAG: UDP-N-acetylmuramate--L-alanine ligase [Chloroflexi bacterium]|nr:UDP-N-acetylmuramate--L-alanine ligase [Chloroflexota bacterium]
MGIMSRNRQQRDAIAPPRVHLVGAGGVHMSAIGQLLIARGHTITGSDLAPSDYTRRLERLGATIYDGHSPANIGDAQLLVVTAAVKQDNPELVAARERGIPVILRAEMVQRLIADREVLAISGSHGKTTTTNMLALMAERGGLDPLVLLGGDSPDLGGNVRNGEGKHAVLEADEYAEAFLQYTPKIALVTNIEVDHLDYYGTEERVHAAFAQFASQIVPDGTLIVCADSPGSEALGVARRAAGAHVERYSLEGDADWRARALRGNDRGGLDATVELDGRELGKLSLAVPGRHNVSNALGALAVAMRAGVDFHRAAAAVADFRGARRHFELIGEVTRGGQPITIVDDYAHHPTEVRATLAAARQRFSGRRLVACFQPHTYSRSSYLLDAFRTCFEALDALYLLPTYAARETPDAGIDAAALAKEITNPVPIELESIAAGAKRIAADLQPGDAFLTIGAGSVTELAPAVLRELGGRR